MPQEVVIGSAKTTLSSNLATLSKVIILNPFDESYPVPTPVPPVVNGVCEGHAWDST